METIQEKKTSKKALVGLILGGISFGEIVLSILLYTSVFPRLIMQKVSLKLLLVPSPLYYY